LGAQTGLQVALIQQLAALISARRRAKDITRITPGLLLFP